MNPERQYITFYFIILLIFTLEYYVHRSYGKTISSVIRCVVLSVVVILFFGYREISIAFGDTPRYVRQYELMCQFPTLEEAKDYGFTVLTYALTFLNDYRLYLLAIASLYVLPLFFTYLKKFPEGVYALLLLTIGSFSFFGFGTNGLRNGLSTTFLIVAFLKPKLVWQISLCALAFLMHKSSLLPIVVFFIAKYYNKPKGFIYFWVFCFLTSLVTKNAVTPLIDIIDDFIDDVATAAGGYIEGNFDSFESGHFSSSGYRWDFLLYGLIPIILGYYYIFKRGFEDKMYQCIYCTYVGANAFWLFTIYIPFNNRFAYLSWFLYPVVLAYPLVTRPNLIPKQEHRLGLIILLNFLFTFITSVKL